MAAYDTFWWLLGLIAAAALLFFVLRGFRLIRARRYEKIGKRRREDSQQVD